MQRVPIVGVADVERHGQNGLVVSALEGCAGDPGLDGDLSIGDWVVRCKVVENGGIDVLCVTNDKDQSA